MNYRLNPETLGEIFAVPAAVADEHIKLAGSAQLKVLLWLLRGGQGVFDAKRCSKAIGLSPADCTDALQYWFATGLLLSVESENEIVREEEPSEKKKEKPKKKPAPEKITVMPPPRPVKPSMKEVISRQKQSSEFSYLLNKIGRASCRERV